MTTYALLNIVDGTGEVRIVRAEYNLSDNSYAFHEVIEVNGEAVSTGNPLPVSAAILNALFNADGGLEIHINNAITIITPPPNTFNTESTTPLASNGIFTGATRFLPTATTARYFYASVFADQASATNGFQILGWNGTMFLPIAQITIVANIPVIIQVPLIYPEYQVKYTNNTVAQNTFWIQSGFAN